MSEFTNTRLISKSFTCVLIINDKQVIGIDWYWNINPIIYKQPGIEYKVVFTKHYFGLNGIVRDIYFTTDQYTLLTTEIGTDWMIQITIGDNVYGYNTTQKCISTKETTIDFTGSMSEVIDKILSL